MQACRRAHRRRQQPAADAAVAGGHAAADLPVAGGTLAEAAAAVAAPDLVSAAASQVGCTKACFLCVAGCVCVSSAEWRRQVSRKTRVPVGRGFERPTRGLCVPLGHGWGEERKGGRTRTHTAMHPLDPPVPPSLRAPCRCRCVLAPKAALCPDTNRADQLVCLHKQSRRTQSGRQPVSTHAHGTWKQKGGEKGEAEER
jgi:hypothetical protein